MIRTIGAMCVALAVGCVAPESPELDETADAVVTLEPCPGCGGNGLRQGEWNYVFSNLDRNALNHNTTPALDVWDDAMASPMSLCTPSTVTSTSCTLRSGWSAWLDGTPNAQRVGIFTNLAKIILPKGYTAVDPDGYTYYGKFGLMTWARDQSWGQAGREIASAGLLALLNSVQGVPICLNTPQLPNHCGGSSATYSESVTFGDAIYGTRYIAISGGRSAPLPSKNQRYGTVSQDSATSYSYYNYYCTTSGTGNLRYPINCTYNGVTWQNPVHVLVPEAPNTWYYEPTADTYDPDSWPQPI